MLSVIRFGGFGMKRILAAVNERQKDRFAIKKVKIVYEGCIMKEPKLRNS